jgi:hypothetical protein
LAVVRGSPFLPQRELNPVQELDAALYRREFVVCIRWALLITFIFGLPLAIAVAIADWS